MESQQTFAQIFATNKWAGSESVSGPGSGLHVTEPVRRVLPLIVRAFGVRTFLDAPCGDFNWMRHVDLGVERYIGADIVPEVVELAARHRAPGREFIVADVANDPLPASDLIFCRDCFVHMADELVMQAVRNMKASGASLLIATTFYAHTEHIPGSTGGWRPVNLQLAPFNFPPPILIVPERDFGRGEYSDKSLGLWHLPSLPDTLSG